MARIEIKPAFSENNILIITSSRDEFAPYVGVLLESVIEHSSAGNNYDFVVLEDGMGLNNKAMLKSLVSGRVDFSLRFFEVGEFLAGYTLKSSAAYVPSLSCARLMIPDLFPYSDKAIWIDADTVVERDIAELYYTDLEGCLLAAVRDIGMASDYYRPGFWGKPVIDSIMHISPDSYFNAGVLLINCTLFRQTCTSNELLKAAAKPEFRYLDQDALNFICAGRVKYIPMSWNVHVSFKERTLAPPQLLAQYDLATQCPYIVHYIGPEKPGEHPIMNMHHYFWKYARNTPFYELFWYNLIRTHAGENVGRKKSGFKNKIKETLIIPAVSLIFPKNTKRRYLLKKAYFKLRGWDL